MSRIKTFRHPRHSIFQSLVEQVAGHMEARFGEMSPKRGTSHRMDEFHPATSVGYLISELGHRGHALPDEPPEEMHKKHGGIVSSLWQGAKISAEILEAKWEGEHEKVEDLKDELKFSSCDPAWIEALVQYEKYLTLAGDRRNIPYARHRHLNQFVMNTLPPDATVALIGDWGTGTDEAIELLEEVKKHSPDVVIHLGDIYYSCTEEETDKFFLNIMNRVLERDTRPIAVYTLSGNHDMYSGGAGFYNLLPRLNPEPLFRPEQAQKASYFCLRSRDGAWQFLGLDTGLNDHDPFAVATGFTRLEASEEKWHTHKVRKFSQKGGRTVLLSHHQLFSAFSHIGDPADKPKGQEATNPELLKTFRKLQQAAAKGQGDIAAWFWGHEHNLAVYEPYLGLKKGRCMGHGAIPHFKEDDPYAVAEGLENPPELVDDPKRPGEKLKLDTVDDVYAHGFVIIRLDAKEKTATASYYQETDYSTPMYEESL